MPAPVVAIVGRPNVGKSSLFNALAGRRIAIVDPTPGVTRDRVGTRVALDGGSFQLFDTGGIGIKDVDNLTDQVEQQIDLALQQAAVILFVVDIRAGVTPLDEQVSERLRGTDKPVLLVANKCDTLELEAQAADFFRLGWGTPLCVSAQQKRGHDKLLGVIARKLSGQLDTQPIPTVRLKLAIVGRRNTGKSTFINALAQAERMIVSEVAGTTRDSVDVHFERDGLEFIAIDTAGVRRKKSLQSDIEFYSVARAERSIRRADVVLLFLDARLKISKVDKKLAEYILEQNKPAIFVVNKWDLMTPMPTGQYADYLHKTFPSLDHLPIAFVTAKDGRNVYSVLNLAQNLHKQAALRIATPELNRVLRQALTDSAPPLRFNRRAKVTYATQVATNPPTIVLFTNGPELFDKTYRRYLVNTLRDHFQFGEVPIKLLIRRKRSGETPWAGASSDAHEAAPARTPKGKKKESPRPTPAKSKSGKRTPPPKSKSKKARPSTELWRDL